MLIKNEYKPEMVGVKTKKTKKVQSTNGRLFVVLGVLGLAFIAACGKGIYMQTQQQSFLQNQSNQRVVRNLPLPASRGTITDRNGSVLALSVPTRYVSADPSELKQLPSNEQLQQLSVLLGVSVAELTSKLSDKKRQFVYLKRQLPLDQAEKVSALKIKGIHLVEDSKRYYPMGASFAHVLGFVNIDDKGQEGLEMTLNKSLSGVNGVETVMVDKYGTIFSGVDSEKNRAAQNGQDLHLSLDQRIQALAHDSLMKTLEFHKAKAGSAVVLDAKTGEILALVNAPTFDPNNPSKAKPEQRRNRAVIDMVEPGSTMKPIPIALALDQGKVSRNTVLNTNPYNIGPKTINDTHNYPSLTVQGVIQKSSNAGSSKMSAMFKPKEMYDFYSKVGYGRKLETGFPGESVGKLRPWDKWYPVDQATMSYGYGIQVSVLQLARAYTMFTNNGAILPVTFRKLDHAPQGEQLIKPETAKAMREMMVSVTEQGGTGVRGAVEGYDVAAKSGTAQKYTPGVGYTNNKHIALFAGFAPAQNPRVVVVVNIDEPSANGYYGGLVAGPAFQEIMAGSLNVLGVAPTRPIHVAAAKPTQQP